MSTTIRNLWRRYRAVPIVYRISLGFVLGAVVGLSFGQPATNLQPVGDLFLRLLKMLVVPLVIFTIISGMKRLSPARLGRVGGVVVFLYMATTAIAAGIGLGVANLINPGTGVEFTGGEAKSAEAPQLSEVILGIVPENPLSAMVNGDLLATIFFVVVFGLALALVRDQTDDARIREGVEGIFRAIDAGTEALFAIVWGVMEFGVIGVFALVASSLGQNGVGALFSLASLVGVIALGIAIHISVTYLGLITMAGLGQSPLAFLSGARDAMVTAFSIRSSSGTLPVTITDAEEHLRIDESVYGFSLPLGATINMDGAAIRQAVTAVFAANVVGVSLGLADQVVILATVVLVSIGTAGVPGAGLIMLTIILNAAGLPLEIVGFVAGVDPILGRIATMNNVTGDLAVSSLAGKWNDAIDLESGVWTDMRDRPSVGVSSDD
ncbi:dicarboxylate/amino acid:cation symporter [Haladaptatus caseinilyticus]|uniref:dicarboxylate/amino acid:cation symporter n=1 Tax=Haladaptatus caseinilyticus TaxID=2993314 RepID=UPI00224A9D56|nr:dicarboxylate/amino acid:cation symporter [Haladaptatus caseinilyticus]